MLTKGLANCGDIVFFPFERSVSSRCWRVQGSAADPDVNRFPAAYTNMTVQCRLGEPSSGWLRAPAALRGRLSRRLLLGYEERPMTHLPIYIYCRRQRTLVTDRMLNESARPLSTWTTEPCRTEQMIPLPVPTSASDCCDGAGAYTPTEVADNVLRCIAESQAAQPPMHFFAFVDEKDVRQQAALSTARCNAPAPRQYTTCRNARCE